MTNYVEHFRTIQRMKNFKATVELTYAHDGARGPIFDDVIEETRSDVITFIHGEFRQQVIQVLRGSESPDKNQANVTAVVSMQEEGVVISSLATTWWPNEVPHLTRQSATATLAQNCVQQAFINTKMILEGATVEQEQMGMPELTQSNEGAMPGHYL